MAEFYSLGKKLLTDDNLMDLFDLSSDSNNHIGSNFDLNSKWHGIRFASSSVPKHGTKTWCLYFDIETDGYNRIQMSLDINGNLMTRSFSGGGAWSAWKQIGGGTA